MKKTLIGFVSFVCLGFSQEMCDLGPLSRASIGTRQGEGIGYKEGYSSVDVFLTPNWSKSFQPFIDARGHIFNNGYYAGNIGIGARYLTAWDWAVGANLFYDFRTVEKLNPSQIGAGLEMLSYSVDFRINGYFPIADTERKGPARIQRVSGNQIIVRRHLAAAYTALNAEIGVPIRGFFDPINLYIAAGPYYLFRKEVDQFNFGNALGGEVRANARILDGLDIGGTFSYDRLFNGRINGYIMFSFPFGPTTLRYGQARWNERYQHEMCALAAKRQRLLAQSVERHEIIPIKTKTLKGVGVDPLTGHTLSIIFVNNLAKWEGKGTFEAPFNSLALAEKYSLPDQIIYVMEGRPYEESIQLKPGQSLQGSGQPLTVEDTYYPPYTESGPLLISPDEPAITLDTIGYVKGVTIEHQDTWGIDATKAGEVIIQNVAFHGGPIGGVSFEGASKGLKAVERCVFSGYTDRAVAINASHLAASELRIRDNIIRGMYAGIVYSGPSIFHLRGNELHGVENGIVGALSYGRSYSIIAYNDINNSSTAIHFQSLSKNGLAQIQIENNTIYTKNPFNDALLVLAGNATGPGQIEAYVAKNSFHGADAVFKVQNKDSNLLLRLEGNWSNRNYALINYEKNSKQFNVDALNKDESGVEALNLAGMVLVPFEPVAFRDFDYSPRFFTPFEGFEEDGH